MLKKDKKTEIHIVFQVMNFLYSDESGDLGLLSLDKLLLLALAKHHGKKGIYPSVSTLAKELKTSSRYVIDRILFLEAQNIISVQRKTGCSNHYKLLFLDSEEDVIDSVTPELEFTGESYARHPNRMEPMNPSSPHPCTVVHPINTNNQYRTKKAFNYYGVPRSSYASVEKQSTSYNPARPSRQERASPHLLHYMANRNMNALVS